MDFMMRLFKSDSKYSDAFSQFESAGASGSGESSGCGDDEESADDQEDEDEDGDGDSNCYISYIERGCLLEGNIRNTLKFWTGAILLFSSAWRFRLLGDKMVAISKEDEVQKILTSIFVTNFPEYAKAKDLWNVCKQYRHVVDAFIPGKRSKKGIGNHHLHANVARFQRSSIPNNSKQTHQNGDLVFKNKEVNINSGHRADQTSYVHAVTGKAKSTEDCEPIMVLDEACLKHQEYSLELLEKVKEFSILANVKVVLGSEGFSDIKLNYMGGLWIMIGFKWEDTKAKFQSCVGAVSWFSQIIQASKEFDIDERITWVDIEGIPLKLWSENTFNRIAGKWGKILYMENLDVGCFHSKWICILTTRKSNIFESFKIIHQGKGYWVRAKETTGWFSEFDGQNEHNSDFEDEQSVGTIKEDFGGSDGEMEGENNVSVVSNTVWEEENVQVEVEGNDLKENNYDDPFNLYPLLNKKMNTEKSNNTESLQYPPGFTPCDVKAASLDKNTTGINESSGVGGEKLDSISVGSRNCRKVITKWNGEVIVMGDFNEVRMEIIKAIQEVDNIEAAQKAKFKWAIEGDEKTKYYHGILNKKHNQLAIRGVLKDGIWIENPNLVKSEFLLHFKNRFQKPCSVRPVLDMTFPRKLSVMQPIDMESDVLY
nr:nucleotide-binding alpha-beta plait domain-containing protein [Tanacetum cinerariifolium]